MCALFDIRWVPSGGTRRRAKRRRSFSDPGINCKLVYRPQRTLGCWFIRRVVAAFASSLPPPPRSVLHSIPARLFRPRNFRKVRLANDETPLRDSLARMEIAGNFIGNGFFPDSRLIEPVLIRQGAINIHFSSRSPSRQRSLDPSSSAREKIPREFDDFELERGGSRVKFREILR